MFLVKLLLIKINRTEDIIVKCLFQGDNNVVIIGAKLGGFNPPKTKKLWKIMEKNSRANTSKNLKKIIKNENKGLHFMFELKMAKESL